MHEEEDTRIAISSEGQEPKYREKPQIQLGLSTPIATHDNLSESKLMERETSRLDRSSIITRVKKSMKTYKNWPPQLLPDLHHYSQFQYPEIRNHLMDIIRIEEPIICHRIYRIYALSSGHRTIQPIKSVLNKTLHRAFTEGIIEQADNYELSDQLHKVVRMKGSPTVNVRKRGDRPIDEIPPSEIAALIHRIMEIDPSLELEVEDTIFRLILDCYEITGSPSNQMLPTFSAAWDIYCDTEE